MRPRFLSSWNIEKYLGINGQQSGDRLFMALTSPIGTVATNILHIPVLSRFWKVLSSRDKNLKQNHRKYRVSRNNWPKSYSFWKICQIRYRIIYKCPATHILDYSVFCLFYFYIDIQIQFDNDIQRVFLDDRLAHDNVFYNIFLPVAGTSCDRLETPKQSKAAYGSALVCLEAVPFLLIWKSMPMTDC